MKIKIIYSIIFLQGAFNFITFCKLPNLKVNYARIRKTLSTIKLNLWINGEREVQKKITFLLSKLFKINHSKITVQSLVVTFNQRIFLLFFAALLGLYDLGSVSRMGPKSPNIRLFPKSINSTDFREA